MPPRYTIRQVVGTFRRKAFGTREPDGSPRRPPYPPEAIAAFYGCLELAEEQPRRGRFESERLLRVLLEGPDGKGARYAKQVPFLILQGDLVRLDDGTLAVEGWDLLQEGDATIADRVARFRSRKRNATGNAPANDAGNAPANGGANGPVTPEVTTPVTDDPRAGDSRVARPQRRGDGYEENEERFPVVEQNRAGAPTGIVETTERKRTPTGWTKAGEVEQADVLLTRPQLDAWASFEGEAWEPFKAAWLKRGFRLPPQGDATDDADTSLRSRLWLIADARPHDLGRWVAEAPGRTTHEIIGHVFAMWSGLRAEIAEAETATSADKATWFDTPAGAA